MSAAFAIRTWDPRTPPAAPTPPAEPLRMLFAGKLDAQIANENSQRVAHESR